MPSIVLMILTAVLLGDCLWWRYADRRARRWPGAAVWRAVIGLIMGGQLGLLVWTFAGRSLPAGALGRPPQSLSAAGFLWHLLGLPLAWLLVVVSTIAREVQRADAARAQAGKPGAAEDETVAPLSGTTNRRQFLERAATLTPIVLTGAAVAYSRVQVREFRVRSIEVALPSLPHALDGLRLALVADLHVGSFTHGRTVRRVVEETNALAADLVLLPGDLINNALADLPEALEAVSNLQSPHGTYLSIGNHDLIENGAEFIRRVKARATLLVNESQVLSIRGQRVQLLGLPWNRDDRLIERSVHELARQVTPGAFPILLAHHPHAFDSAAAVGIPLTVSGHTHGGQLMLSRNVGFGPLLYRYWSGLYQKAGGAALVVSNGVGNWFPLRTNAPAEIIHLTLRALPVA